MPRKPRSWKIGLATLIAGACASIGISAQTGPFDRFAQHTIFAGSPASDYYSYSRGNISAPSTVKRWRRRSSRAAPMRLSCPGRLLRTEVGT